MKEFTVSSVEELSAVLDAAGPNVLYRGQTKHHGPASSPSATTSFDRQGCVPSEMVKWSRYASGVLEYWLGQKSRSLAFSQAVLQHYGWRSFYLDATSEPAVAAWFASHVFKDQIGIDLCEDYEEHPVMLRRQRASYEFENGVGHFYIIDKALAAERVGVTDLSAMRLEGCRPRFDAQSAWLLGPLRNEPLPQECYYAQVSANRSIFRSFAAKRTFVGIEALFPKRSEDPVLHSLLELPWAEIKGLSNDGFGIPAFRRTIELPEYHDGFQKTLSPHTALFRNDRISENVLVDGLPVESIVMIVPEIAVFGTADSVANRYPLIEALLREHGSVSFEIDTLILHAGQENTALYGKGVSVTRHAEGLVEVSELMVEHPGMRIVRAGVNAGWYCESKPDGTWARRRHAKECPCGNDYPHLRHLSALTIVETWLSNPNGFG